jgi:hypothetical protein
VTKFLRCRLGLFIIYWFVATNGLTGYQRLFPGANLLGALVLLGTAIVVAVRDWRQGEDARLAPDTKPRDATQYGRWQQALVTLAFGTGVVLLWHSPLVAQMRSLPIHSRYADMLPLMLEGFGDIDAFQSPFRDHQVPWTLHNYYLPTTFLPYYAAYRAGVDIRWVTVGCLHAIALSTLCLVLAAGSASAERGGRALAVWLLLSNLVYWHVYSGSFVRITQLGPYWLYVTGAFVSSCLHRYRLAALCFLLALCARESSLALAIVPYLAVWKYGGPKRGWSLTGFAFVFVALIFLPFLLADPFFLWGNIEQYSSLTSISRKAWDRYIGFSGFLSHLGYTKVPLAASILLMGFIALHFSKSKDAGPRVDKVLRHALAMTTIFNLFAPVAWEYVFVEGVIVFAVMTLSAVLHASRERTASPTATS